MNLMIAAQYSRNNKSWQQQQAQNGPEFLEYQEPKSIQPIGDDHLSAARKPACEPTNWLMIDN